MLDYVFLFLRPTTYIHVEAARVKTPAFQHPPPFGASWAEDAQYDLGKPTHRPLSLSQDEKSMGSPVRTASDDDEEASARPHDRSKQGHESLRKKDDRQTR